MCDYDDAFAVRGCSDPICQHLSSADIIHLAETSRTHWTYVASSKTVRQPLMSAAHCDGRGIVAQAKVFGYWGGDASHSPRKCLGADAKPCSDCGVNVCDVSRPPSYRVTMLIKEVLSFPFHL